jgi:outer membrane protein assembly factor BamB
MSFCCPRFSLRLLPGLTLILATAAFASDWPQFRGPAGQGHSTATSLAASWDESTNIRWKVAVPGSGWSSPALLNNQIWLTSAVDDGKTLHAFAFDRSTGQQLHDVVVFNLEEPGPIHSKNSHASPTPVLEGDRVYVHFGAHGTACLDTSGKVLWTNRELTHNHRHGPGGSPVLYKDLLILNCDGSDVQFVVALDKATGQVRWKTERRHIGEDRRTGKSNVPMAYSTPLLAEIDGRTQLLSCGSDSLVSYHPEDGSENWWFRYDGYSNVPRPVLAHGMVFISSGYDRPEFFAVRTSEAKDDITDTHLAWNLKKAAPLNPSPLAVGNELYLVSDNGIATCLDAVSGTQHWQERLGGNFSASPTFADGLLWFLDENGKTTVVRPGTTFQQVAVNTLEGRTLATPAFVDKSIYLRTDTHLYCIERPE